MYCRNINELDEVARLHKLKAKGLLESEKGRRVGIDWTPPDFHKTKRSNPQNSFYWKNCTELALFMQDSGSAILVKNELTGKIMRVEYNPDIIHEMNKSQFGIKSTAKLPVKEFVEFMDRFFAFWIQETQYNWTPLESTRGYFERNGYALAES